ncbi:MarR family winged helix-turn-helix transcriptional regulator [Rhodobacter capsulatus]|uniref:MarR family winged helix-turn-helix transcriptional regulator n=1 Tax=Rhodobacter capsulatus TaxID=1061 RepID=UPI00402935AC
MRHGPLPQARLAELLEIEPISLSRLVDRMAEAGWVERRPDPNDRRIRIVHATDQTRAQIGAARHIADSIYAEALAGLPPPDASETMTAMLRRIISNLSQPTETDHDR